MSTWSIKKGATTKTLAAWGVAEGLVRTLNSQAPSTVEFFVPMDYDGTAPFAYDDSLTVLKDAVTWFVGRVTDVTPVVEPGREGLQFVVSDAWDELERIPFEQSYQYFNGWIGGDPANGPVLQTAYLQRIVLNQSALGAYQGTRAQLKEILDWAISKGVSLQYVEANLPDITPPPREEKDIWCADAIRRQLAYMDAVTWFDYSTSPPTLNIKRRQDMTTTSIDLSSYSKAAVSLKPLYRRQVPMVKLTYEKQIITNGRSFLQVTVDQYPVSPPSESRNPLLATITLQPRSVEQVSQDLETAPIDVNDLEFWKLVKPELADATRYKSLALVAGSGSRSGSLPNYIVSGGVADWMNGTVQEDTLVCEVEYVVGVKIGGSATINGSKVKRQRISVRVQTTDLTTDTYTSTTVTDDPREDPSLFAGLAQEIYNDLSVLNFAGSVDLVGDELPAPASIGQKINLLNGRSEWATMAALVQGVHEDVHSGRISLSVGANRLLSAEDLVELMRHNRTQVYSLAVRSGASVPGGLVTLPAAEAKENTSTGEAEFVEHVVHDQANGYRVAAKAVDTASESQPAVRIVQMTSAGAEVDAATAGKILLQLSEAVGHEIKLRWYSACKQDGTEGYVLALGSPWVATLPTGKTDELA